MPSCACRFLMVNINRIKRAGLDVLPYPLQDLCPHKGLGEALHHRPALDGAEGQTEGVTELVFGKAELADGGIDEIGEDGVFNGLGIRQLVQLGFEGFALERMYIVAVRHFASIAEISGDQMAKKLYVRTATTQDEQAIFDFYAQNQHQFVFQRDPAVWKERIASGAVTMIHDDAGKIVAAAIAYPIKDAQGTHAWSELGSVRVQLDGIGLAKTLISAMILNAWLLEPPQDRFVLEIVNGNSHSAHVFTKLGATAYTVPAELEAQVKSTVTAGAQPVTWYQMGTEIMPSAAQNILDSVNNPVVKNTKTGEEYEFDFSRSTLVTQFKNELQTLAGKDLGNPKTPDLSKGLKSLKP